MPPRPAEYENNRRLGDNEGVIFVGEKGKITCCCYGENVRLLPESLDRSYQRPAKRIPRSAGPYQEWIAVAKGGPRPGSHFEHAALLTEVVQFFRQDDLKKLLALSTASHLALVLLGASLAMAGSLRALQGASLHVLAHGVGKALLFLSVGALSCSAGTRHIRDLGGVIARAPVASAGFLVGALTVTGVPPFAGFWSKLLMVSGAVSLGGIGIVAGALIVAESLVAFAWFLWVGQRVFLGPPSPAASAMAKPSLLTNIVLLALMALCLGISAIGLPLVAAIRTGAGG